MRTFWMNERPSEAVCRFYLIFSFISIYFFLFICKNPYALQTEVCVCMEKSVYLWTWHRGVHTSSYYKFLAHLRVPNKKSAMKMFHQYVKTCTHSYKYNDANERASFCWFAILFFFLYFVHPVNIKQGKTRRNKTEEKEKYLFILRNKIG